MQCGVAIAPRLIMPGMGTTRWRLLTVLAMLISAAVTPDRAPAQTVDPAYRFRTHRTPHFAIHFHEDEDRLAAELAAIAESVWSEMAARPGVTPPRFTHVVLTDQSDSANGFANPFPRNTITLYATAPTGADRLNPADWLRTLFIHEFTHIVHLDRSGGWALIARGLFGRVSWAFPNITLPAWQIEGIATWAESTSPAVGRLHAGDFLAIVDEAARAHRLEPLDRANGGLTDWPGSYAQYAYGAGFHRYLAERFGPETLVDLSSATARSLPYFGTLKFKRIYGSSLGTLWRDYRASVESAVQGGDDAPAAVPSRRRLTHHGHVATGPRYLATACDGCGREVAYSIRTPHDRPALYRVDLDTLRTRHVATRILGSTLGVAADGTLYFDQHELHRNVGVYSDLYALDPIAGRVTTLTRGARLLDPDVSPDGRTLVAVQSRRAGQRDLVLVDLATLRSGETTASAVRVIASGAGVQFNAPRWSPDGRRVVASRQAGDQPSQIVVVDAIAGDAPVVAIVTQTPDMRWVTPTWRPDGRAIVAAGASGDAAYNLYDVALEDSAVRQLTTTSGGATWPDVSRDGSTIVYVGYDVEGSDLYEIVCPPDTVATRTAPADSTRLSAAIEEVHPARAPGSMRYRPWRTLLPTSWTPIVIAADDRLRFGAAFSGTDVLGYHAYGAAADWIIDAPDTSPHNGSVPDWTVSYTYRRWQPQLQIASSRITTFDEGPPSDAGLATSSTSVEHLTAVAVQLPVLRARFSHALQLSAVRSTDVRTFEQGDQSRNRSAMRASWRFSSAQQPGYAVSPERGVTFGAATELIRRALGASGNATTFTTDARLYLPGFGRHHVVAARVAGGSTAGDTPVTRVFLLGGGAANAVPGSLGSEAMSLLRGFAANTFAGRHIALVNIDYRWPIARPQRGLGAWPFMLHTVHAAVIGDIGHVWTRRFDAADVKTSVGSEISANLVLGYYLPVTATMGVAYGHDGSDAARSGTTVYARVGYAF